MSFQQLVVTVRLSPWKPQELWLLALSHRMMYCTVEPPGSAEARVLTRTTRSKPSNPTISIGKGIGAVIGAGTNCGTF